MIDCNLKYNRDRERETQEFLLMHYVRTYEYYFVYVFRQNFYLFNFVLVYLYLIPVVVRVVWHTLILILDNRL